MKECLSHRDIFFGISAFETLEKIMVNKSLSGHTGLRNKGSELKGERKKKIFVKIREWKQDSRV